MTFGKILSNKQCNNSRNNYFNLKNFIPHGMKRALHLENADDYEPMRKKRVYEEKMSKKLLDFHIYENQTNNVLVEEIDDWVVDDLNLESTSNAIVEEPVLDEKLTNDFFDSNNQTSNGIILSDELKTYIENCKKAKNFTFSNNKRTGKELVIYHQISNTSPNSPSYLPQNICDRIVELDNWTEDDDVCSKDKKVCTPQIVTYPSSSLSESSSLSNISESTIPDAKDVSFKENLSDADCIFLKNEDTEFENVMEID